ncbi:hypothetical protein Tco_0363339 [Tanacetum coccineum]
MESRKEVYKILLEDDYQPSVQHQRRVNPKIHDVIKKEVEKLLDAGLIYPISDSPWVSPVHCVPKKVNKECCITRTTPAFEIPSNLFNKKDAQKQIASLSNLLQEFDFKVIDTKWEQKLCR